MKQALGVALMIGLLASTASAGELHGVTMSDSTSVGGRQLELVGMGLRSKWGFKVYVLGLYMETPTTDASEIITSKQARRVKLHIMRSLSGEKVGSSIASGFERNSNADELAKLQDRIDELQEMFPAVSKGDSIVLTYVPGQGTTVEAGGEKRGTIQGKDFADALLEIWFGADPADGSLKEEVLGKD